MNRTSRDESGRPVGRTMGHLRIAHCSLTRFSKRGEENVFKTGIWWWRIEKAPFAAAFKGVVRPGSSDDDDDDDESAGQESSTSASSSEKDIPAFKGARR